MTWKQVDVNHAVPLTYPMITPLVTSATENHENVMAVTWSTPLTMNPLVYGVSINQNHFSHELIEESGEFGVCFLDFEEVEKVLHAGRTSGRNINKFREFGLQKRKASVISAPLLASAITALECKVQDSIAVADNTFFIGKVLVAWVRDDYQKESGVLDMKKTNPVLYLGANRFTTTQDLERWIKPE